MGLPWLKREKIDTSAVHKLFGDNKVLFEHDAINFEDCIMMIVDRINAAEEDKQTALDKVKKYEEEINADARVKEIKAKYEEATKALYRGFAISENDEKNITKWKTQHDVKRHGLDTLEKRMQAGGAIGGRYHYEFLPTSIGTIGTCVCGRCAQKAFEEAKGDREKYRQLKKKYDAEFDFSEL